MTPEPIYTRMFQVQKVWGVSQDTVRRWDKKGIVKIVTRGRISLVLNADMHKVFQDACGAECGAEK
jgi:predicted site-specific integrase-resolvase